MFTNPLWLIKTRMCTQPANDIKYRSLLHAFQTIYREEGIRGYYRGIVPALFGVSHGAIQFMVYEELKQYRRTSVESGDKKMKFVEYVGMAATSKAIATIATYPYQVIKARIQSHTLQFTGVSHVVGDALRKEGVRGLYRGLGIIFTCRD